MPCIRSRHNGRPFTGNRSWVPHQPDHRSSPPRDRTLRRGTCRGCDHQTRTVERGPRRFLRRDARWTGKYRVVGCDKSSEPSQQPLVCRLPNSNRNSDSNLCDSLPLRRNNWERRRGSALAPPEPVLERSSDKFLPPLPSSPSASRRSKETRELENDLPGSAPARHHSKMAQHNSRFNLQRSNGFGRRVCPEPLRSVQHHSLYPSPPFCLGNRGLGLGAQPESETSS